MFEDPTVIIAVISAITALIGAFFTYRASVKATNVEDKKVDQEAYDQAILFYQKQLDDANKQIDRVTTQMDRMSASLERVSNQLATEQNVSTSLRSQVRTLDGQIELLRTTVADLRARLQQTTNTPPHP